MVKNIHFPKKKEIKSEKKLRPTFASIDTIEYNAKNAAL